MTYAYEPSDFNELTVFLRWRGTFMPMVLCRPALWMLLASHVFFLYLRLYRPEIYLPPMPWKLILVPTSLLTFFLVFYSGNCFQRYYNYYSMCMGMSGAVMSYVGLLRIHLPKASPDTLYNLSRHLMASVYVLYYSAGGSEGGKLVTEDEWRDLLDTGLISESEKKTLAAFRGFRPWLLQVWGLRALAEHLPKDSERAIGAALPPFQAEVLKLRGHCDNIVSMQNQPVPFPYYHTLTLQLSLNLLLMAYSMIEFETVVTIPCFAIVTLVCLGLKETAVALADPFGADDVDFETDKFLGKMMLDAKAIMQISDFSHVTMPLLSGKQALAAAKKL